MLDYLTTLFRGYIKDEVYKVGFDAIDNVDYLEWLAGHGINKDTLNSPLPILNPNILFAYPNGDSSSPPTMNTPALARNQ